MKFLCVCEGGNSRSVGLAFLLKYYCGQDAIAYTWRHQSPETMEMLCNWAEHIVLMNNGWEDKIPEPYRTKIMVCDVGDDRYFQPHPDLLKQCQVFIAKNFPRIVP